MVISFLQQASHGVHHPVFFYVSSQLFSQLLGCTTQDGFPASLHLGGDADTHGSVSLPDSATAPAGAILLDRLDHATGFVRISRRDQNLIQRTHVHHRS